MRNLLASVMLLVNDYKGLVALMCRKSFTDEDVNNNKLVLRERQITYNIMKFAIKRGIDWA